MFSSYSATEVHYHVRSISLPSRLHPSLHKIEKELKRLKTWDASQVSTNSLQSESIKTGLTGLAELYNCVQELIGCPITQQALLRQHHQQEKHIEKPLDMSIGLLDVCGSARELLLLMKEHVLDLQSALRRKGVDSSINSHICAYICFRKKARKDISTSLKTLKKMEGTFKSYPFLDVDHHHLLTVIKVLRELSSITISLFKKLLLFMYAPELKKNTRGWSLFSRMVSTESDREKRFINEMGDIDVALCTFLKRNGKSDAKDDVQIMKMRLGELDGSIRDLEARLECLFRCLLQQRVSLLNLLTH
ncbi:uncharacterized protein LOC133291737 [Gastrolobium bilobum]|uniref:uncharacterized protein LOC133291737 n=1 Tax=Gastrolobium bilobum TaxID=150636 RepID=UPI002AB15C6F|nr:uncharacterized protein LOC133291737 [Gastrolobium bilobum]